MISKEGQMILAGEDRYRIDQAEQKRLIARNARKKGKVEGKAESIESNLRVRFPNDFSVQFQNWRPKLFEKPLPVLESLLPLSVSCASLNDFTQKL